MTPPRILTSVLLLAASCLAGCDMVLLDAPLVESEVSLTEHDLDGAWYQVEEESQPFFLQSVAAGTLLVAGVSCTDEGCELDSVELKLGRIGDGLYVSAATLNEPVTGFYFAKVSRLTDSEVVLLAPDVGRFQAAVEQGALAGTVSEGKHATVVEVESGSVRNYLSKANADQLWNRDKPIIVRRFRPDLATSGALP